jgi:hypothetical protein
MDLRLNPSPFHRTDPYRQNPGRAEISMGRDKGFPFMSGHDFKALLIIWSYFKIKGPGKRDKSELFPALGTDPGKPGEKFGFPAAPDQFTGHRITGYANRIIHDVKTLSYPQTRVKANTGYAGPAVTESPFFKICA